jgi:hypothetical protein
MPARDRGRLQCLARELLLRGPVTTRDVAQAAFPLKSRFSKRDYERAVQKMTLGAIGAKNT